MSINIVSQHVTVGNTKQLTEYYD